MNTPRYVVYLIIILSWGWLCGTFPDKMLSVDLTLTGTVNIYMVFIIFIIIIRLYYLFVINSLSTYLLTDLSPSWEAANWADTQEIPSILRNRTIITVFTRALHWPLSWARLIQFIPSHSISLRSILILSTHLRLRLPSGLFPSGFWLWETQIGVQF
jgi:hypothetical protein